MYNNDKKKSIWVFLPFLLAFVLALPLVLFGEVSVYASNTYPNSWSLVEDEELGLVIINDVTGDIITQAGRFDENGNFVMIDIRDYYIELTTTPTLDEILYDEYDFSTYEYEEIIEPFITSTRHEVTSRGVGRPVNGNPIRVTPFVQGPATITTGQSVTISESFSASAGVTAEVKRLIRADVGASWNTSLSTSSSFGITFNPIPNGRTGHVEFTPRFSNFTFQQFLVTYNIFTGNVVSRQDLGSVSARPPVRLSSGFADGTFRKVIR